MSDAIAVRERHLTIPECALFKPTELVIAKDCTQEDFIRIVRAVVKLDQANALWLSDAVLWAVHRFGKKQGLEIFSKASGSRKYNLLKHLLVATEFPPEHRWDGYLYVHYRRMLTFPREWSYGFMERQAGKGLSSRILRSMAASEFNSEHAKGQPKKKIPKSQPNRQVGIPDDLYVRLRPFSSQKVNALIIRILEDWLKQQSDVHKAVVAEPINPESRPTYAERRKKQIESGESKPIAPKPSKNKTKLKRAWTDCSGPSFLDGEGGAVKVKDGKHDATRFKTEAEASAAEREFFETSSFHELVAYCDVCKAWHVRHVYNHPAEGQEKTARIA